MISKDFKLFRYLVMSIDKYRYSIVKEVAMIKFRYLTYNNFVPMAKWYEEMAKEGYQIEKIVMPFIHKFKKSESKDLKYKISLAANEGVFTKFSKEELADYDQMAEDYGWHLIDRSFNLNLYRINNKACDSLYNDDKYEIEILKKGIKGEIISLSFSTLVVFFLAMFTTSLFKSSDIYYSNYSIFMAPAMNLLLIQSILFLGSYIRFKKRNKDVEKIENLKFIGLGFGKFQALITIVIIILVLLAIFLGSILQNVGVNNRLVVISLIPNFLAIGLIYYFFKKIKLMDTKKSNKKLYFILVTLLVFLGNSAANIGIISKSTGISNPESKTIENFYVENAPTSLLSEKCEYYKANDYDIVIKKTRVKSERLASDLFNRIVKNAKDHPCKRDFVKDISKDFSYDKIYSFADYDSYLILKGKVVLEVDGNIYDEKDSKDIEKIIEGK